MTTLPNTIYPVTIRTDKSAPANSDHRLVTYSWKAKRDKETKQLVDNKRPAIAVSIPKLAVKVEPTSLQIALQTAFEDMQRDRIVEHVEEQLEAGCDMQAITVSDTQISYAGIAAWAAEQTSGKLSRKLLTDYYDNEVAAHVLLAVAKKLGAAPDALTAEQSARADKIVSDYRNSIAALSNPNGKVTAELAAQMERVVNLAEESKLRTMLLTKLTAYQRPAELAVLEDL